MTHEFGGRGKKDFRAALVVSYLEEAAALAEALFVAVNSDASVARLKGAGRPVVGQNDRAAMLAALQCVDHVTIFDADTPHELLRGARSWKATSAIKKAQ